MMHQVQKLVFYIGTDCHLCDQAWELLEQAGWRDRVEVVNIEGDIGLLKHYMLTIPVVRDPAAGRELGWPFTEEDLQAAFGGSVIG